MWETWDNGRGHKRQSGLRGLSDCRSEVQQLLGEGHVFSGARLTYNFTGKNSSWVPFSGIFTDWQNTIANAIANRGYRDVRVTISSTVMGEGHGTVTASTPVDHNRMDDAKNNFRSAIQSAGVTVSSDSMNAQNPTAAQICGGSQNPPAGQQEGGSINTPTPGAPEGAPSWLNDMAKSLGMSIPIVIAILGLGVLFVVKR